jgi:hypothetical protein
MLASELLQFTDLPLGRILVHLMTCLRSLTETDPSKGCLVRSIRPTRTHLQPVRSSVIYWLACAFMRIFGVHLAVIQTAS